MSVDVQSLPRAGMESDYNVAYRALSSQAVASCVLGVLSMATLLSYEYGLALGVVPIVAVVLGIRGWLAVRRLPEELTGKMFAQVGVVLGVLFLIGGYTIAGVVYATEVPAGYERLNYSELQPDESSPGQVIPPDVKKWDGKRVFLKGYAYPGAQQQGIKKFVLCRDNGDCCFGGQPKLTDMVLVELKEPLALTYSRRVQRVAGTFHVSPAQATDNLGGVVYQLEADYLK
jgi:hypothetical protein